ncbi:MAG: hypothetical protein RBS07_17505 [Lentimicrobium sp.]|jgi:chromosome segregation ATPase|nr:hypothetical protein [Lentimicrobium sp.]
MKQNDNDLINPLLDELKKIGTAAELIKKAESVATNAARNIEQLELQNKKFIEIIEEQKRLLDMTAINDQDEFISKVEFDLIETSLSDLKENFAHSINESAVKLNRLENELSNNLRFVDHYAKIVDELKVKTDHLQGLIVKMNNEKKEIEKIKEKILSEVRHSNNVASSIGENFAHFEMKLADLNEKVNDYMKDFKVQISNVKIVEFDSQLNTIRKSIKALDEENEQNYARFDRINKQIDKSINFRPEELEVRLNKMKLHLQISLTISAIVIGYIIVRELFKLI